MNIEEFAPHMRPAGGLDNPSAGEQLVEPGIAVGVNDATEVLQMGLRMLAFAIGRVEEQSGRRPRAGKRPLIANIGPQPAGLGLAGAWRQTGTGVSSTCKVSLARTSAARASTSGFSAAAVAPTQPDRVEVSRLTPPRAKISA